jgi:hypothetical protein
MLENNSAHNPSTGSETLSSDEFSIHRQLVFWLFVATATLTAGTALVLLGADQEKNGFEKLTILPIVAVCGTLGAFVSALRRLYSFQHVLPVSRFKGLAGDANLYLIAYSSIPPLIGSIAAVILYVVFASGIIKGDLFPAFNCEVDKCDQFLDFLRHWKPALATDYAKAVVWGFVSGFSERFVPDILNRLSEKANQDN